MAAVEFWLKSGTHNVKREEVCGYTPHWCGRRFDGLVDPASKEINAHHDRKLEFFLELFWGVAYANHRLKETLSFARQSEG